MESHISQLPMGVHPDVLARYEAACPGFAQDFWAEAKAESAHRREGDRKKHEFAQRGQTLSFVLSGSGLIAGTAIALLVSPWAGAAVAVAVPTVIFGKAVLSVFAFRRGMKLDGRGEAKAEDGNKP